MRLNDQLMDEHEDVLFELSHLKKDNPAGLNTAEHIEILKLIELRRLNKNLQKAFVITDTDNIPTALEEIAIRLRQML